MNRSPPPIWVFPTEMRVGEQGNANNQYRVPHFGAPLIGAPSWGTGTVK